MSLKNIAGNDVSIFLFRFELRSCGIDFVLNEVIAADMYEDIEAKLKPIVHTCCKTLLRYKHLSVSNTIMDGNILTFRSLTEAIDTESAAGRLMGHILGALAEFERSLIVERTQAGLKAAKKRGTKLGRKPSLSDEQRKHARELLDKGESPLAVSKLLNNN